MGLQRVRHDLETKQLFIINYIGQLVVQYIHLFCSWFCGAEIQVGSHGHFPSGISWGIRGQRGNSKIASSLTSMPLSSGVVTPRAWASHSMDFSGGLLSSPLAVFQRQEVDPASLVLMPLVRLVQYSFHHIYWTSSHRTHPLKGRENRFCFLMGE